MESKADMLKKITVAISPSEMPAAGPERSEPLLCEFIYGIGPGGLTPFEYAMAGKSVGDEFLMNLDPSNVNETFEHLCTDLPDWIKDRPPVSYTIKILSITTANNREIISAMANLSDCTGCCGH